MGGSISARQIGRNFQEILHDGFVTPAYRQAGVVGRDLKKLF